MNYLLHKSESSTQEKETQAEGNVTKFCLGRVMVMESSFPFSFKTRLFTVAR